MPTNSYDELKKQKLETTQKEFDDHMVELKLYEPKLNALKSEINSLLGSREPDRVEKMIALLDDDENNKTIMLFADKTKYLLNFLSLLQYETNNGTNYSIDSFVSADDILSKYQILTMLLRRIEFNFPVKDQLEVFLFLLNNKMSYFHIIAVLSNSEIYNRIYVCNKLSEYMSIKGEVEWANLFKNIEFV